MKIDVLLLPRDLQLEHCAARSVVVFDVLRATTSMTAALAAGVREIRVYETLSAAADAARAWELADSAHVNPKLLCGEVNCLPPPGFDLGNSPGAFNRAAHAGRVVFMSTTNGTRAIVAARNGKSVFIGALVNAGAVARALVARGDDVTLLCAGTDGQVAMEDLLGAGAVLDALRPLGSADAADFRNDTARLAHRLFAATRDDLPDALSQSQGGRNLLAVGLGEDISFCARLDVFSVVGATGGAIDGLEPIIHPYASPTGVSTPPL